MAKIASPGSCAHAACAPGKNVALDRKQREAIINCLWRQTGWPGSPKPDRPGQVWLADITCIQTQEGWLYLSGILDHCSRRCIGWHAHDSLASSLVSRAWEKACHNQPLAPGLLHHSDRGVQYASTQFQTLLHSRGATASMSRKANPYDNAIMESFFATLKTECFQNQIPKSRREAKLILFDYIETFYNRYSSSQRSAVTNHHWNSKTNSTSTTK